jgi:hypothetical protein
MGLVWRCDRCKAVSNAGNVDDPPETWEWRSMPVRGSQGARSSMDQVLCADCDDSLYEWLRAGENGRYGQRFDGVAFVDAMSGSGGVVTDDTARVPPAGDASADAALPSPAAAPTFAPVGGSHQPNEKKGTDQAGATRADLAPSSSSIPCDTELRPGRWTCRCGHTRVGHSDLGYCHLCACDRYRRPSANPLTNDGAAPGRATPS